MIKIIFSVFIILCFITLLCSAPSTAQPSLKLVNGMEYNWGRVTQLNPKLTAQIEIKNEGTEELKIDKPVTSCGCTAAAPDKNTLQPGETTMMTVTLDITGKSGEIVKTVALPSNDAQNPQTTLTIKANVYAPLEVEPKMFVLNQLQRGKKSSIKISVKNISDHLVTISAGESHKMNLVLKKPIKLNPGKSVEIEAYIIPIEKETTTVNISLLTDDKEMPAITISGYCNVAK